MRAILAGLLGCTLTLSVACSERVAEPPASEEPTAATAAGDSKLDTMNNGSICGGSVFCAPGAQNCAEQCDYFCGMGFHYHDSWPDCSGGYGGCHCE